MLDISKLVIRDDVPIPERKIDGIAALLRSMAVGQSGELPKPRKALGAQMHRLKRDGIHFVMRKTEGGYTFWRVAEPAGKPSKPKATNTEEV